MSVTMCILFQMNILNMFLYITGSVKRIILNCINKGCEEAIPKWIRRAKET